MKSIYPVKCAEKLLDPVLKAMKKLRKGEVIPPGDLDGAKPYGLPVAVTSAPCIWDDVLEMSEKDRIEETYIRLIWIAFGYGVSQGYAISEKENAGKEDTRQLLIRINKELKKRKPK